MREIDVQPIAENFPAGAASVSGGEETSIASLSYWQEPAIGGIVKRVVDIVISAMAILWLAPLFVLVSLAIKYSSPGPIFFSHRRVGFKGQTFPCIKFRTMVPNGDRVLNDYLAANPAARVEWDRTHKLKDDPRVTSIGAVLRKTSLDELPQLFNVIAGDMSLVGPRPVTPDELVSYGPDAQLYARTRPGITGAWQVSGRSDVTFDGRVALDVEYVRNWSMKGDFTIIARTVPAVLLRRGAY